MATTTPNFGWAVPTSSDLVKNGATAIETLGDSIDASLVDLKGGTTGQVLAKTSATDMDFTWTTPSAGSSGSSNVAGKNGVLNSNFSIWQRGTSTTLTSTSFVSDRWQAIRSVAGATATRQVTGDTTNLPFIQYCARIARNSGQTGTGSLNFATTFESVNSIPFAGKAISYSFYARAGANYSAASGALAVYLTSGTGTDQNNITGSFTGATQVVNSTATLTTTWQRFTYTGTVAATATQLSPQFQFTPVGTAGANDYYEITGVQVEIAASASAYSPNGATLQGELAACLYYFNRLAGEGNGQMISNGQCWSSTNAMASVEYPIMRVAPTITYSTASFFSLQNATNTEVAITALASYSIKRSSYKPDMTVASGLVAGNATSFQLRSTGTVGTLDLSAEL